MTIDQLDPEKYRQHNPFSTADVRHLLEWMASHPRERTALRMVRLFQDGAYVFTQSVGDAPVPAVFFDVFRFEGGLIVEHWLWHEPASQTNESGHSQTDGPTEASDIEHTARHKALVRDYYQTVHLSGDHAQIPRYVSVDHVRHEPNVRDGIASFLEDLKKFNQPGRPSRTVERIDLLLGEGDFVLVAATGTLAAQPCAYIDLYRVENDMLVEHWGFMRTPTDGTSR